MKRGPRTYCTRNRLKTFGLWLLLLGTGIGLWTAASAAPPENRSDESRFLAIYLPGVHFAQIERKLELGNELSSHLMKQLGDGYNLPVRVYATAAALDADAEHIALGLLESPLVAARLARLLPLCVASTGTSIETRLVVLARPSIKSLIDLRSTRLFYAMPLDKPNPFFDNFIFEGELALGRDHLAATRDVASALSLASLRKADALVLYEGDEALGQSIGLRALYRTTPLPRPTLVAFDRRLPAPELQRLREAMNQFQGRVHPGLRAFRATSDQPYQALHNHMEERPRHLPALLELADEAVPLPLPHPASAGPTQVPVLLYAPALDKD